MVTPLPTLFGCWIRHIQTFRILAAVIYYYGTPASHGASQAHIISMLVLGFTRNNFLFTALFSLESAIPVDNDIEVNCEFR